MAARKSSANGRARSFCPTSPGRRGAAAHSSDETICGSSARRDSSSASPCPRPPRRRRRGRAGASPGRHRPGRTGSAAIPPRPRAGTHPPGRRLVPPPELVLLVDEDAAEPAGEIRLAVPLRLLARVDPELPGLAEAAARPVQGGQVSHRPALLEVEHSPRARLRSPRRSRPASVPVVRRASRRADVVQRRRANLLEAQLGRHLERLLADTDRLLVLARRA